MFFIFRFRLCEFGLPYCHIYLNHTQLLFDGGKVIDYLKLVKTFLDANPNEVLTLLFTNPEGLSITDVWKPAFDGAGNITHALFSESSCVQRIFRDNTSCICTSLASREAV